MSAANILVIFIMVRIAQFFVERYLSRINRTYYSDDARQKTAMGVLGISGDDMKKTSEYSKDKFSFGTFSAYVTSAIALSFIAFGGLGLLEGFAQSGAGAVGGGEIVTGLFFFGLLAIASMIMGIPFEWYRTFTLEEKHGYNRQDVKGFIGDRLKGLLIGAILGGLLISGI